KKISKRAHQSYIKGVTPDDMGQFVGDYRLKFVPGKFSQ
ncbi:unnamed protein product, partial [marine sediment metagenome]